MLYFIVRPAARIWLKACFRKIHFHNSEVIPTDKPVLLAANHPTAFIEPCILATHLPLPLHFIVRGDLFVKPFYIRLLNALNMVPIYRLKDGGFKNLKNNYDTFRYCHQALKDQKAIMILAEGTTIHEKRLRPLRKGTARIAFGAIEAFGEMDLHIIPVGVNYTYADQARQEAMIEFGEPIRVMEYWDAYKEDANEATRVLLADLRARLEQSIIIIDRVEDENLVEKLLVLYRNDHPMSVLPVLVRDNERLKDEKQIAHWINQLPDSSRSQLLGQVEEYYDLLHKEQLEDVGVAQKWQFSWRNSLILVLGALPFALGVLGNCLPYLITQSIVDKKVKAIEFKLSVWLSVGMFLYIIYWFLLLLFVVPKDHPGFGLFWLSLPFLAYFATLYSELFAKWWQAWSFQCLDKAVQQKMEEARLGLRLMLEKHTIQKTTT
ncbi:MAG: 1-acyl-sn-glycerol-3-phosphate acyltransferase [Bacteroidota bacterium]